MTPHQKVAVVTGSSRGWGRAIAEGLAAAGVRVVVNGRNADVEGVAEEIRRSGGEAVAAQVPAHCAAGVDELLQRAIGAYGRIDIWANSLGCMFPEPLLTLSEESWETTLRVQLTAVFLGCQRAARRMCEQGGGGRIINVTGSAAFGLPGAAAHAASKGGVLAATYSWAGELERHGITVNAIRGCVESHGMEKYLRHIGLLKREDRGDGKTLRSLGFYRREEAAPLAVWLASDSAQDVTGWYIGIDGEHIVAYDRISRAVELDHPGGWTSSLLERVVHPAILRLQRESLLETERRPPANVAP